MRLRLVRRRPKPAPARPAAPPPRPAELENPYAPCFGRPRSFSQLRPPPAPKP